MRAAALAAALAVWSAAAAAEAPSLAPPETPLAAQAGALAPPPVGEAPPVPAAEAPPVAAAAAGTTRPRLRAADAADAPAAAPAGAGTPRPKSRAPVAEAAPPRPRPRTGASEAAPPALAPPEAPLAAQAAALAPRPAAQAEALAPPAGAVRPRPRPDRAAVAEVAVALAAIVPPTSVVAVARSLRPSARPQGLAQRRAPAPAVPPAPEAPQPAAAIVRPAPGGDVVLPRRGAVCGNPEIRGETIAPVTGRIRGCGVAKPVRVTSVAGVALSAPAIMDCPTAQALHTWVVRGAVPAIGQTGGGLARLEVAAHYICRTRNNRSGQPLSEHARGRAIDIAGFTLRNGQTLRVAGGWRGPHRDILRAAYRAACGPFGTTLGPGSDGYHEDHYHFDTARHRNGSYCR